VDLAQTIQAKYRALAARLDEATLRLWAATEARSIGRGGVSVVANAAGMSRTTVYAGLAELDRGPALNFMPPAIDRVRVRAPGGGRKTLVSADPTLLQDLDALVEPTTRGDPMSALRWTCKSATRLAQELNRQGHQVSQRTVCDLLAQMNYSLQSVRKTREGAQHADRDAQFHHIARTVAQYQGERQPVSNAMEKIQKRPPASRIVWETTMTARSRRRQVPSDPLRTEHAHPRPAADPPGRTGAAPRCV